MKNTLVKDTCRDIKKSFGRFMSIVSIVALGVAFFTGLKMAPIDMKKSVDTYYDQYNLMDLNVVSTLGLTDDDIKAIAQIDGVADIFPTYSIEVLTKYSDEEIVIKIHGMPLAQMPPNNINTINHVKLVGGRLPINPGEVVIEKNNFNSINVPIGTKLSLTSGTETPLEDMLAITEVVVVGTIQTPYYLSVEKGSSAIGSGIIRMFMMLPQEDFKLSAYTEAYVTVKGANDKNSYTQQYFEAVELVKNKIENISGERINTRYNELLKEATNKLNTGKTNYENEKSKALKALDEAAKIIEKNSDDLAAKEIALHDAETKFNQFTMNTNHQIVLAEKELEEGQSVYNESLKTFNVTKATAEHSIKEAESELSKVQKAVDTLNTQLATTDVALKDPNLAFSDQLALTIKRKNLLSTLEQATAQLDHGKNQLTLKKNALIESEKKFNGTRLALDTSKQTITAQKVQLAKSNAQSQEGFRQAHKQLEEGKSALEQGRRDYDINKVKAEQKLLEAEVKIKDSENKIAQIKKPKWYILDRNSHLSYVDFKSSANGINSLATYFPLIFFLVAALICLTTMTRMVDEQRINIGTLKALGYHKPAIAAKFIVYGLLATLIGSLIGLAIGFTVFPTVIFNTLRVRYVLPQLILTFNPKIALGITCVAISVTTLSVLSACTNELRESPSVLMRPKVPKEGKRILLEQIPFLWNGLNFTGKVTLRNIFRYKKRFVMTVLGIAGCTALLLTGFGIKDSIQAIVDTQFGPILKYNVTINLDKNSMGQEKATISDTLSHNPKIEQYDFMIRENGKVSARGIEKPVTLLVPENIAKMKELITLKNSKTDEQLVLSEEGAIISEQIANQLQVKVGDTIDFIQTNSQSVPIKVVGITENYVLNYVYMSPNYYKKVFNKVDMYNVILGTTTVQGKAGENGLSTELSHIPGVTGVSFNSSMKDNFETTVKSLNAVVVLMIVSAGALAFVVLYNLTNVNISERMREIATIKVLGFYNREVSAYIYRENLILTIIGTIGGLGLGVILHKFIMGTFEMDNIMFGLSIRLLSFVLGAALTMLFAVAVNFAMYYKLKNIKMIESLKSVD
ncbi:MAG: FtsX-like permease family protein [Cellulosilyticaceae bacterium]